MPRADSENVFRDDQTILEVKLITDRYLIVNAYLIVEIANTK